jgi:D-alanyl-D-alanine carboxypeptidase
MERARAPPARAEGSDRVAVRSGTTGDDGAPRAVGHRGPRPIGLATGVVQDAADSTILADGNATGYGLGVSISAPRGRRRISHGGAVSGYTTSNHIYPNDRSAIVVFTNIYPGAAGAPERIAERIANTIFAPATTAVSDARELAQRIYDALTKGTIDRAVFTPAANAYFTQEVLTDYAASLAPLGSPTEFVATGESLRGGMTIRSYRIRAGGALMELTIMTLPDGRIDQYIISRAG